MFGLLRVYRSTLPLIREQQIYGPVDRMPDPSASSRGLSASRNFRPAALSAFLDDVAGYLADGSN